MNARAVVEHALDDLRSDDVRFLQQAAGHGPLLVRLPSDELVRQITGRESRFPVAERRFLAQSLRWVDQVEVVEEPLLAAPGSLGPADTLVVRAGDDVAGLRAVSEQAGAGLALVTPHERAGFPSNECEPLSDDVPRVVVTGCFDWLHSGHVRFFMDAAEYGALHVVVGSDRNVALLKGEGHPLQREEERRYMVGSTRPVHRCLVSSGSGWMDAEPEIDHIRPACYVVNEDGDQPEKREFCRARGIEYVVLERVPHAGLPARSSTDLRGF